jgi:hypothetical protein
MIEGATAQILKYEQLTQSKDNSRGWWPTLSALVRQFERLVLAPSGVARVRNCE